MSKCDYCGKAMKAKDSAVEHIKPLVAGGKHEPSNLRMVHIRCHRKLKWYTKLWRNIRDWFEDMQLRWQLWLDSFEPCYKESMGYNCKHQILSDGRKECGGPND